MQSAPLTQSPLSPIYCPRPHQSKLTTYVHLNHDQLLPSTLPIKLLPTEFITMMSCSPAPHFLRHGQVWQFCIMVLKKVCTCTVALPHLNQQLGDGGRYLLTPGTSRTSRGCGGSLCQQVRLSCHHSLSSIRQGSVLRLLIKLYCQYPISATELIASSQPARIPSYANSNCNLEQNDI